jgi:hypothetical protein
MDIAMSSKGWESENHANFHNVKGLDINGEQGSNAKPVAGFKSLDHVKLPTQFAWSRCNDNGQSDAANAYDAGAALQAAGMCITQICYHSLVLRCFIILLCLLFVLFQSLTNLPSPYPFPYRLFLRLTPNVYPFLQNSFF